MKTIAGVVKSLELAKKYFLADQNNLPFLQKSIKSIPIDHLPNRQQLRFELLKEQLQKKIEDYKLSNRTMHNLTENLIYCINKHLNNKNLPKQPQAVTNKQLLILRKKVKEHAKECRQHEKSYRKITKDFVKIEKLQEPKIFKLLNQIANFIQKIDQRISKQIHKITKSLKSVIVSKNYPAYLAVGGEGMNVTKPSKNKP